MRIRINDFAGTFPRLHPTKLPDYAAQSCKNVIVERGVLSPSTKATLASGSVYLNDNNFLSAIFFNHNGHTYKKYSNDIVNFTFSPVNDSFRLYWTTEDKDKPLMFMDWDISDNGDLTTDGQTYQAGMPAPNPDAIAVDGIVPAEEYAAQNAEEAAEPDPEAPDDGNIYKIINGQAYKVTKQYKSKLFSKIFDTIDEFIAKNAKAIEKTADISDQVTEAIVDVEADEEARVYGFTYVNKFGDESAPTVNNEILYIKIGDKPVLTLTYSDDDISELQDKYAVSTIRVYRSLTDSLGRAQLLFVKDVPFVPDSDNNVIIMDELEKDTLMLGEPITTINYDPPRDNLKGLGVTDYGVGYGYVDKNICLSEPYLLYAWPRFYELGTQQSIMGMGHYDNTIVVATSGNPILLNGISPESMGVLSLPLYEGCVSSRSMVNLAHGCMYASNNGLVLVAGNSAKLLTDGTFATEDWQAINPSSIHACAYKGGYLFFWDNGSEKGSGYIDLGNPSKGVLWFDDYALNTFLDDGSVQLINKKVNAFNKNASVHQTFNPDYGDNRSNKTLFWQSKVFNIDSARRLLAGQVIADSYGDGAVLFRLYGDGVLIHENAVNSIKPFRIKNHSGKRDFYLEIEASVPVREIAMGETMRDLIL